ncbi:DUF4112 domain-containing protein [Salinimonas iocasae]|uniref:DUF4112 domain-containing protein n=1 Tax=Salinimonas iocasae TaxID=2572577 RepID=A0A5B7YAG5_9ALTE|nr:DUF4112 domain-containing protein [Salinimonas iocasae]QCZ92266.1 DUF4112 domain-containing protein [Salinimonas iocasae]
MTSSPQIPHNLQKAQRLANTMDSAFRIPGIGYRIGLDGIIGLIPGIGDVITVAIAARIVHLGHKMGMSKALISKMLRNIVLDFLLGAVPLVGDVADFFFKANKRNVKAMEKWWLSQNEQDIRSNTSAQLDEWEQSQRT